jgi:hypothetical protein
LRRRADCGQLPVDDVLSTAPATSDSPLGALWTRALPRRGVVTDARAPGVRLLEWSLDPAVDDVGDNALVAKVNPASWIDPNALAERLALPAPVFHQFHANVLGAGAAAWLPPGAWSAGAAEYDVADGETVVVAVDVGGSRATTAMAVTEDLRVAEVEVLEGDEAVLRVPDLVLELGRKYVLREVVFDPWRFQSEALRLEREHGLTCVSFPQSHSRMLVASEKLHAGWSSGGCGTVAGSGWTRQWRARSPAGRAEARAWTRGRRPRRSTRRSACRWRASGHSSGRSLLSSSAGSSGGRGAAACDVAAWRRARQPPPRRP